MEKEEGNVCVITATIISFFERIKTDPRIGPTHIAVYTALMNLWIGSMLRSPLVLFSSQVMPVAKISGRYTFQRTLRELNRYGYIVYQPSHNKYKGSRISLIVQSVV